MPVEETSGEHRLYIPGIRPLRAYSMLVGSLFGCSRNSLLFVKSALKRARAHLFFSAPLPFQDYQC